MRPEKGIGYLFEQYLEKKKIKNWNRIESLAKGYGIYSPKDLAALIREHSPIRRIGEDNMHILKMIYNEQKKNPKKSFFAIAKDNLEKVMVLQGQDPRLIHWGSTWEKVQKSKGIRISRKDFKDYEQIIKNLQKKYTSFMKKDKKTFLSWYQENKNSKYMDFIDDIIKSFKDPKNRGKGYYMSRKGRIDF
tara:strand:+ start:1068 stop:1637 length:570 start_codon:yes stop_codon:yes gene_type:complete